MIGRLDDEGSVRAADPSRLIDAFLDVGRPLAAGYRTARDALDPPPWASLRAVVFAGMGGSAAAGDLVAAAYRDRAPVPMLLLRGYRLPAHCGDDTLVVCLSYSGSTEETLAAYGEARDRGAPVVAVCAGGPLARMAASDGVPLVELRPSAPMPRAALGTLAGAALAVLAAAGLVDPARDLEDAQRVLSSLAEELGPGVPVERNEAKAMASWIGERIPVVWGSEGVTEAAAWRWKTAFNENAEVPAFASVLPELDHHEVVGWADGRGKAFRLAILREDGEHQRVAARVEATLEELGGSGLEWREVRARGASPLTRALSLAMLGDAASAYHGVMRGVDPGPIEPLERIKRRLAGGPS